MNRFSVGDKKWLAFAGTINKRITCPDCQGKRYLTVIMGDGSQVTVDCTGCREGYNGCSGEITAYEFEAKAEYREIIGLEIRGGVVTYHLCSAGSGYHSLKENELYETEELAKQKAAELAKANEMAEVERRNRRVRDHHGMAFQASYHKSCIRTAEREIARASKDLVYHKSKLAVASPAVAE